MILTRLLKKILKTNTPDGSEKANQHGDKNLLSNSQKRTAKNSSEKPHKHSNKGKSNRRRNYASNRKRPSNKKWSIDQFQVPEEDGKKRFHDFSLPLDLMHGICDLGFKYCTPIQAEILSHTLQGRDAVGKAQTGTGKTAAFLITAIKLLLETPPPSPRYLGEPRIVIIAPTRELALQIGEDTKALTKYTTLNTVMLIGGIDYEKQKQHLAQDFVDIVIATPGRLLDFINQKQVYLDLTETLVLDEADRMLDMGFIPQVRKVVLATPRTGDRQTLLFSATFNDDVLRLAKQWTWNPVQVEIATDNAVAEAVEQKVYMVSSKDKYTVLANLLSRQKLNRVIVFVNRRYETRKIAEQLKKIGIRAGYISGDVPQKKRISILDSFKAGKVHVLVATDVAGRGIHVEGISHVINYNLPEDAEDYIHRVGRTGRAGTQGISISFACEDDAFLIDELEKTLGIKLPLTHPPEELL